MWYRSLATLVMCGACVAPPVSTKVLLEGAEVMKLDISFSKAGQPFDIRPTQTASSLIGVVALVSVVNDTQKAVTFPCAFLQEQGVAVLYQLANVPTFPPYSIGSGPASYDNRSNLTNLAPGQACQVEHSIVQEGILAVIKEAPEDVAPIDLEFFIPDDPIFGVISGLQVTRTVTVSKD